MPDDSCDEEDDDERVHEPAHADENPEEAEELPILYGSGAEVALVVLVLTGADDQRQQEDRRVPPGDHYCDEFEFLISPGDASVPCAPVHEECVEK